MTCSPAWGSVKAVASLLALPAASLLTSEEHLSCLRRPPCCFWAQLGLLIPSHSSALVLGMLSSVLAVSQRPQRPEGDVQIAKLHGLREWRANTSGLGGGRVSVMH